jgi:transposase
MPTTEPLNYQELYYEERAERIKLQQSVDKLQHQLDQLLRLFSGSKSERFIPKELISGQLDLGLMQDVIVEIPSTPPSVVSLSQADQAATEKRKIKHFAVPESLIEVVQEIHPENLPEGSKCIGQEVSYRLECSPQRLYAKKIIRYKYLLPTAADQPDLNSKIITAALPDDVFNNCMAGPSLLATLVTEKYTDHLPVYRQMIRFERAGIKLAHATLIDWINKTAKLLWLLYEALKLETISSHYVKMDETGMPVMDKDKQGKTHKGFFWAVQAPEKRLVFFEYQPGRSKEVPKAMLKGFKGYLQSDGYEAYASLASGEITLLCCAAHSRRYFEQALDNDPARAQYVMSLFQTLYDIERTHKQDTPGERHAARQQKAKPIWDTFAAYLTDQAPQLKEGSAIHKAFAYTMKRFKRLTKYLDDGLLDIDNNSIENSIRAIALGRRNFMFSGSHEGAARSAMLYSLTGTCKMNGINPLEYLTDVLKRINTYPKDQINDLLPNNWKPASLQSIGQSDSNLVEI